MSTAPDSFAPVPPAASQDGGHAQRTFADLLNRIRLGAENRAPAESFEDDCGAGGPNEENPVVPVEAAELDADPVRWPEKREGGGTGAVVRPYGWTGGRTTSEKELRVEAMISTTELAGDASLLPTGEYQTVARLCRSPQSVAEVASSLAVPLRVARMVLGEMAETGMVTVHRIARNDGSASHIALMERVLSGLRRL